MSSMRAEDFQELVKTTKGKFLFAVFVVGVPLFFSYLAGTMRPSETKDMADPYFYMGDDRVGPFYSALFVYGFFLLIPVWLCRGTLRSLLRKRARLDHIQSNSTSLSHAQRSLLFLSLFLGVVHGLIFSGYHQRLWFGEVYYSEQLSISKVENHRPRGKDSYFIKGPVIIGDGETLEVDCGLGRPLLRSNLIRVPVLVESVFFTSYEIGVAASTQMLWLIVVLFASFFLVPIFSEARAWYEREKLYDSGSAPL